MIHKLFTASFEASKDIIYKSIPVTLARESRRSNSDHSKDSKGSKGSLKSNLFLGTISAIFLILAIFSYPKSFRFLVILIDLALIGYVYALANLYPKLYHRNWADLNRKRIPGLLAVILIILIPLFPIMMDGMVKNAGKISIYFQISLWFTILITCYYYYIKMPLETIKGTKEKKAGRIWGNLIILDIILLIISAVSAGWYFSIYREPILRREGIYTSYELGVEFEGAFALSEFIILIMLILFVQFKMYLTYYYMEKYNREYRELYKISDDFWFLNNK